MNHDASKMYLEYYAKTLLETLFPDKYVDLKMDETPDLRMNNDYGIEVIWAMFDNQGQANGVLSHIAGKKIEQIDQRYVKTMRRIQTDIITNAEGSICGYNSQDAKNKCSYSEILTAYRKKKVLQFKTKHTDLFVYPPLAQLDSWLGKERIEECLNLLGEDSENPFDHIIIFEEPTLYLYDNQQKKMRCKRGTEEEINKCKIAADSYSGWSKRYSR